MNAPGLSPAEFARLPLAARIYTAAAPFLGMRYSLSDPSVPYAAGSIPSALVGRNRLTNCSTMSTAILMAVYPDREWTQQDYADLQVFAESLTAHPKGDSPIVAAERHNLGQRVPRFEEHEWHLVQTWNRKNPDGTPIARSGGHSRLVYYDGDRCWTIEATGNSKGGVGAKMSAKTPADFSGYALVHMMRLWP